MIKLLVLIILFIIIFPIVKMWLLMRRARRNFSEAVERSRRQSQSTGDPYGNARRQHDYSDVGEYADFEDVRGATREPVSEQTSAPTEEQVVDAEFEDI